MKSLDEALHLLGKTIKKEEVEYYIEKQWIKVEKKQGNYFFEDIDIARAQLIIELQIHIGIEEEAISLILSLLDQLHANRAKLSKLVMAIEKQPRHVQAAIFSLLNE